MPIYALLLLGANPTASDFFPLVPGMKSTYEERSRDKTTMVDEIREPVTVSGAPAYPVDRKDSYGRSMGATYYRTEKDTVLLVGQEQEEVSNMSATIDTTTKVDRKRIAAAIVPAVPVFRFSGTDTNWAYNDTPKVNGVAQDPTSLRGSAKLIGQKTVLNQKVDVLEVKVDCIIGEGKLAVKIQEKSLYGKGIGLFESTRKTIFTNRTDEVKTVLTAISSPAEVGKE